jgi:hypothetical protein
VPAFLKLLSRQAGEPAQASAPGDDPPFETGALEVVREAARGSRVGADEEVDGVAPAARHGALRDVGAGSCSSGTYTSEVHGHVALVAAEFGADPADGARARRVAGVGGSV